MTGSVLKQDPRQVGPRLVDEFRAEPALTRAAKSLSMNPSPTINAAPKPIRLALILLAITASIATLPVDLRSQSLASSSDSGSAEPGTVPAQPSLIYVSPSQKTKSINYVFDAFGPYPLFGAAFAAGLNQSSNSPPEWGQGAQGYGKRIGSDFAIAATATTARYGLAQAFKEDTLYYRCECKGILPRFTHAAFSTLTARRGMDGHRVFSIPALLAPYAGSFTAVYGWYPDRFGPKDAFRIGNYTLLASLYGNIGLEFIYGGPHALLSRMHLNNTHSAPSNDVHPAPANDTPAAPASGPPAAPTEGPNQ